MKCALFSLVLASSAAFAAAAQADVSGTWQVAGKVSAFSFVLTCDFTPDGERLQGVCTDTSTNSPRTGVGKSHRLTAGNITGDKVSWTFRSSFLLSKFDVVFKGMKDGDRMTGSINAEGHGGTFTAVKL